MAGSKQSGFGVAKNSTQAVAVGGMIAALVFVGTYFLKLPVPIANGYIHLGDGFILLGALLLGLPAIPAAAIGSMLADLLLGYATYALPTLLIKGGVAAVAVLAVRRHGLWKRSLWLVLAELLMVAGYFVTEWLLMGYGFAGAWASVPANMVQGASGVLLAIALEPMLRRIRPR